MNRRKIFTTSKIILYIPHGLQLVFASESGKLRRNNPPHTA